MISAEIIADSIGPSKVRLTTFLVTYPRFIHAEFMTHRMLSRNAASSRAIPLKKTRWFVNNAPASPIAFSQNKAGMQASENLPTWKAWLALKLWVAAGRAMSCVAWAFEKLGVHKQHANRILEPWLHITVVVTATDWDNFFALRYHPMAQPEFQALAELMWSKYSTATPKVLKEGQWHLPFVREEELLEESIEPRGGVWAPLRKSVARCARTSYLNHDNTYSPLNKDSELFHKLLGENPLHASPAEHQAQATRSKKYSGNLRGWIQFRKTLRGECVEKFTPPAK